MESRQGAAVAATVSLELVQDWLDSLQRLCPEPLLDDCLKQAGIVSQLALAAKVILSGEIARKVVLKGIGATKGAKAAIEAAGGSVSE